MIARTAARPRRGQGGRLVPGAHGVRAARARRPLDPGRCALAIDAEDPQPARQVPRVLPPVRALGAARGGRPTGSSSTRTSPYMLLVADVVPERRRAMTAEEQALFGIDKLNVARSEIPAVTHVDYSARIQTVHADTNPAYHALHRRVPGPHRLPGARQHLLQRARRAHRVHARGRLPLLHGHRHRAPRRRQLPPRQGGAGPEPQARLQGSLRARLSCLLGAGRPACADTIRNGRCTPNSGRFHALFRTAYECHERTR